MPNNPTAEHIAQVIFGHATSTNNNSWADYVTSITVHETDTSWAHVERDTFEFPGLQEAISTGKVDVHNHVHIKTDLEGFGKTLQFKGCEVADEQDKPTMKAYWHSDEASAEEYFGE